MRIPVQIADCGTGELAEAELFDEVTVEHFLETQREWRPVVLAAAKQLAQSGSPGQLWPRHFHWDWSSKEADLRILAFTFFGITSGKKLQGLMKLDTAGHAARLPEQKGRPLAYVDYVESAPWNIKLLMTALGKTTQYAGIGMRLIEAAIRKSMEEGFKGRVGLHSLSGSERFYLDVCGMKAFGPDPAKQNLLWCEFTPEQAEKFLAGGAA
ncbi:MAG: GNAT family N-acetyltransferase [Acidobacteriota bacterium]|nr:GNAT family N-acetyltransferase [Acidobacteriota bacterium]